MIAIYLQNIRIYLIKYPANVRQLDKSWQEMYGSCKGVRYAVHVHVALLLTPHTIQKGVGCFEQCGVFLTYRDCINIPEETSFFHKIMVLSMDEDRSVRSDRGITFD